MMQKDTGFWKAVAKRAAQVLGSLFLLATVFFLSAGRLDISRAWLFFGLNFVSVLFNMVIFLKFNPEVIRARSEIRGEMKGWDKIFAVLFILFLIMIFIVCGLDVGRFQLSNFGMEFLAVGVIIFVVGWLLVSWAMIENKYFECTVRIQNERKQKVITKGPYAIVRHPGYTGMILFYCCAPLIIGSLYGLIPALIVAVLFVMRTYFEDKTLQAELEGYRGYAKKVKYRLLPLVW
jgi:protein-S-isoprenylcysteine O-methyltransferase Ste14